MSPTTLSPPMEATPLSIEDKQAVRDFMDRWVKSDLNNDYEATAALWAENAVFMPPNRVVLEGRAATLDWIRSEEFAVRDLNIDLEEISGVDDLAYLRGSYAETFTSRSHIEPKKDTGKFFGIVRRQPDGTWLATHWTWNTDLPLEAV